MHLHLVARPYGNPRTKIAAIWTFYRLSGALEKFIESVRKKVRPQLKVSRINLDETDSSAQKYTCFTI